MPEPMPAASGATTGAKSPIKWILLGCGGCFVVFIGLFAVIFGGVFFLTQPAVDAAEAHVRLVREGDVRSAYDGCSGGFRERNSLEAFEAFVAAHATIYEATELSFSSRQITNDVATLEGTASGPRGTTPITFTLVKEGGAWKVQSVRAG